MKLRSVSALSSSALLAALLLASCSADQATVEPTALAPATTAQTENAVATPPAVAEKQADAAKQAAADVEKQAEAAGADAAKAADEAAADAEKKAEQAARKAEELAAAAAKDVETALAEVPLPASVPVLKVDGRELTLEQLKIHSNFRQNPNKLYNSERDLPLFRGNRLVEVGRTIGAFDAMAAESRSQGGALPDEKKKQLASFLDRYAGQSLYREFVTDKFAPATDEVLMARYEADKAERFRQDEELRMRQIFVSGYTVYTVKEGDTLESIARTVSGDESAADRILSNETKKPRGEELAKADSPEAATLPESIPAKALTVGEKLMVPMGGEELAKVEARIKEAREKLLAGESFVSVATTYSENARPGELWVIRPKRQDRPVLPEISQSFMALEDGKFSEIIRTKHGFHLVYRETYVAEGFQPFDSVKNLLESNYERDEKQRLTNAFFDQLLNNPELVTINAENAAKGQDTELPTDVIVTIGGTDVTREQLNQESRDQLKLPENRNPDAVRALLPKIGLTQGLLVQAYRKSTGWDENPAAKFFAQVAEDSILAQTHFDKVVTERLGEPAEEVLKGLYESEKESLVQPESMDLSVITLTLGANAEAGSLEALKAELSERMAEVKSLEDFRKAANDFREQENGRTIPENGSLGNVLAQNVAPANVGKLRIVEAPGLSPMIESTNNVSIYWVNSKSPERQQTFEEVRDSLKIRWTNEQRAELQNAILKEYGEKANVELVYTGE